MLVLSRNSGEWIDVTIHEQPVVQIKVDEITADKVKLCFKAPSAVRIDRREITIERATQSQDVPPATLTETGRELHSLHSAADRRENRIRTALESLLAADERLQLDPLMSYVEMEQRCTAAAGFILAARNLLSELLPKKGNPHA